MWGAAGISDEDYQFSEAAREITRVAVAQQLPAPPKDKACACPLSLMAACRACVVLALGSVRQMWVGLSLRSSHHHRRTSTYYSNELVVEIERRIGELSGVPCAVDVTGDSGSTIVTYVFEAVGQGSRLRSGLSRDQRESIKVGGCKLLILSHDQWVSSTGRLQLYSCARRNDNTSKADLVRKAVRSTRARPPRPGCYPETPRKQLFAKLSPRHLRPSLHRLGGTLRGARIRVFTTSSGWMHRCSDSTPVAHLRPIPRSHRQTRRGR